MSRRLIVGPRADTTDSRWPVMLIDPATPGLIRGDMFVSSLAELRQLGVVHDAPIEVAASVRGELPGTEGVLVAGQSTSAEYSN